MYRKKNMTKLHMYLRINTYKCIHVCQYGQRQKVYSIVLACANMNIPIYIWSMTGVGSLKKFASAGERLGEWSQHSLLQCIEDRCRSKRPWCFANRSEM